MTLTDLTLDDALLAYDRLYTKETGLALAFTAFEYYRDEMIGAGTFVHSILELCGTDPTVPAAVFAELIGHYNPEG